MTDLSFYTVSPELFQKGYNLNFTRFTKEDYNGCDYIPWSAAFLLLKQLLPTLQPETSRLETLEDKDLNPTSVMLYVRLRDAVSGLATPELQYPIMDNRNKAKTVADGRDISDNTMRAYTKVIAMQTGIGLRLFTREEMDLGVSKKGKDHPKFLALKEFSKLKERKLGAGPLPKGLIEVDFGSELYVIRQQVELLKN